MQRINADQISGNPPNPGNPRSIFMVICAGRTCCLFCQLSFDILSFRVTDIAKAISVTRNDNVNAQNLADTVLTSVCAAWSAGGSLLPMARRTNFSRSSIS